MPIDSSDYAPLSVMPNPLDAVEAVLDTYKLDYIRMHDDELVLSVAGQCASYRLFLNWQDEFEALQIICQFPQNLAAPLGHETPRLLMEANAQLWLGHFELGDDRAVQFRYTTLLKADMPSGGVEHMNDLFKLAVAECDRFFPALRLICDDSGTAANILAFAMQDTLGEG